MLLVGTKIGGVSGEEMETSALGLHVPCSPFPGNIIRQKGHVCVCVCVRVCVCVCVSGVCLPSLFGAGCMVQDRAWRTWRASDTV